MKSNILIICLFCLLANVSLADDRFAAQRKAWLQLAEQLKPTLVETTVHPVAMVKAEKAADAFQGWRMDSVAAPSSLYGKNFKAIRTVTLDFGRHLTGYFNCRMRILTKTQDAPIRLRLFFGELPAEINTPLEPWHGALSRAWMQDEVVTLEDITQPFRLPRRVACRYVRIELLAESSFDFCFDDISFTAVSSVASDAVAAQTLLPATSQPIRDIYRVALSTLHECMQTVYEDGPKRDQRLWIGDLYLESLANSLTFRNHQLTKRCLYLLAAMCADDGRLLSNCFERPTPHPEYGSFCLTYALLYNSALLEYLRQTNDRATADDLWPIAKIQMEDALQYVGRDGLFDAAHCPIWIFLDWRNGLDASTPMQGAICFALQETSALARMLGHTEEARLWTAQAQKMQRAAHKWLYDKKKGVMVSGNDRQVSVLSQAWAVKGGILTGREAQRAIRTALTDEHCVMPGTPYATHYLIDAMHQCKMHREARQYVESYWGGMVSKGADTFWEAYDPHNDFHSPYGFSPLNSACHAWSCTPAYFIMKYPEVYQH